MKNSNNALKTIVVFSVVLLIFICFWGQLIAFSNAYKEKGIWDLLSSVASIVAVCFAIIATHQANRTIEISHNEFKSQNTPALLYSKLPETQLDVTTEDGEYRSYLTFANHGRSIALLREIRSSDKSVQYNLSPPISIGVGEKTVVCVIHHKNTIQKLYDEFVHKDVGAYESDFWNVNVLKSDFGEGKIVELSRPVKITLLYWNLLQEGYATEVEFQIKFRNHIYWFVDCSISSETNMPIASENNKMPKMIINYSNF